MELTRKDREFIRKAKSLHPDCVVLYGKEESYYLIDEDAKVAEEVCGLKPTDEEDGLTATFHLYDLDTHLPRLIHTGHRVYLVHPDDEL